MKNAPVIGFWEANGVEIWPFPFRSVPFQITFHPIKIWAGPGHIWLVPIRSVKSPGRGRAGVGRQAGQGSGRQTGSDLFDLSKRPKL